MREGGGGGREASHDAVLRARLLHQGLATAPSASVVDVVRHLGAVQSQELSPAKWSLGARAAGSTVADVDAALASGAIVRTHVLRPTWHFVDARDLRWLQALTGHRVVTGMASWERKLGLDAKTFARSERVIAKALRGGAHLTRQDLGALLAKDGIMNSESNRLAHLVMHAELEAVICSGVPRGKQQTYALVDERVPPDEGPRGDAALAELARRYFTSHGPATLRDFRWWSSLRAADAARAVALCGPSAGSGQACLVETEHAGLRLWGPAAPPAAARRSPRAHLMQGYDEYLVAHSDTKAFYGGYLPPQLRKGETTGTHAAVLDGRVIAHSHWRDGRDALRITLQPRRAITDAEAKTLAQAAGRMGAFLGKDVVVE